MEDIQHRFPLLSVRGLRFIQSLEEHPRAPRFTHPGVHRLTPAGLRRARAYAAQIALEPPRWRPGETPAWLAEYLADCARRVPFYRRASGQPARLSEWPTCSRADLARQPWSFVPDDQPLDGLLVYNTSGVSGHPLDILTQADVLALYVPLVQAALALHGVALSAQPEQVAIALVGYQRQTYTYAAALPVLNEAGLVKINLWPADWRDPADRAAFIDACAPELISGDPLSLAELARLPVRHQPRALVSTAMTLTPGLQAELAARFACPVVDIYSLNEAGPLAARVGANWHWLQPRLVVEILDPDGQPCPPGGRGEVTLTGGFNPFLPLVRYRTADYADGAAEGEALRLVNLEGRPPVAFHGRDGRWINNIDVSRAARDLPLARFQLHQAADGALTLALDPREPAAERLRAVLLELFGADQSLSIQPLDGAGGKVIQYTSDERTLD